MVNTRLRRLTDLFVTGKAIPLPDSSYLWVQALNSYQRDECMSDAQIGRSRLVMALREKGTERLKIEGQYWENGRDEMISELALMRASAKMSDHVDKMRADPEWKERMDILMRSNPDDTAAPLTAEEIALLSKINQEIMVELKKREQDEVDYQSQKLDRMSDEEVIDEMTEEYLERRGGALAEGEYRLTEVWHTTRWCSATTGADGDLDHSTCDGHAERAFATRGDVREVPNSLIHLIAETLTELNVAGRDPKGSARAASSSNSSTTPNEPEDSPPSTSTQTSGAPPGTSTSPSPTP